MKIGDRIYTPRFCTVIIKEIFEDRNKAEDEGFKEPTHYESADFEIYGKHTGENRMIFAAVRK